MGLRGTQGNESLPMSQVAKHCKAQKAAASGCIRQGNATEDGAAPCSKSKTCVCLVGKGYCMGNVLKNTELKLRGQGKQAHVTVGS